MNAAVQARTWLSAVDIVAANIDARIRPTQNGPSVSIASIGNPSSGSKSDPVKTTRLAKPMMTIMIRKGVCQAKNQSIAVFLSSSVPRVITLDTT